jgi:hypothetical protein
MEGPRRKSICLPSFDVLPVLLVPSSSLGGESMPLQDVRLLGKAGQWLKAAEACKQLLSPSLEHAQRAVILRETGFCLRRAATQSSSVADFRSALREAQEFYLQASKEFQSLPETQGESNHCTGACLICASLTAQTPLERKRILNEARMKELEVFCIFMRERNVAGASLACISLLESTVAKRQSGLILGRT